MKGLQPHKEYACIFLWPLDLYLFTSHEFLNTFSLQYKAEQVKNQCQVSTIVCQCQGKILFFSKCDLVRQKKASFQIRGGGS